MLGIIDVQRGFMPAVENEPGFGELPVQDGALILDPIKALIKAASGRNTFTTQDWHPEQTAHFADEPNFVTTWPRHCVAGRPGALLHPELESVLPRTETRFYKGQIPLEDGKDDTSYSGYFATSNEGLSLPAWLQERGTTTVVLGGLALDYCVGKTALDLREKAGLDVLIATQATRGIAQPTIEQMLRDFEAAGVRMVDMQTALDALEEK